MGSRACILEDSPCLVPLATGAGCWKPLCSTHPKSDMYEVYDAKVPRSLGWLLAWLMTNLFTLLNNRFTNSDEISPYIIYFVHSQNVADCAVGGKWIPDSCMRWCLGCAEQWGRSHTCPVLPQDERRRCSRCCQSSRLESLPERKQGQYLGHSCVLRV